MPLNDDGFNLAASALQTGMLFAQLHSAAAGLTYTDNVCPTGRKALLWSTPQAGDFGLRSALKFTGGDPGGPVYSVTLWDDEVEGTCYGEFVLTSGDTAFNGEGAYQITAIDFTAAPAPEEEEEEGS